MNPDQSCRFDKRSNVPGRLTALMTLITAITAVASSEPQGALTNVKVGDAPEMSVMNGVLWKGITTNEKISFVMGMQSGVLFTAGSLNELGHTNSAKDAEDIIKVLSSAQVTNNQIVQQMDKIYSDVINVRLPAFEVLKAAVFQLRAGDGFDKDQFVALLRLKYVGK